MICYQIKTPGWAAIFLLLSLFSFPVEAYELGAVNLSDSERQWLQEHQDIIIAYDGDFPPYSEQTQRGGFQGYAVDVVKMIEQRLGIKFEVYPDGVWKNLYSAAKNREVDVVVTMNPIPERRQWFVFSDDYIFLSTTLFARVNDHRFTSASDISLARIALVEGYAGNGSLLESFPNTTPILFPDMTEALSAVEKGVADIYFGPDNIAKYQLKEHGLQNVEAKFIYQQNSSEQTFGIRKDWPELVHIINKTLASITTREWKALNRKWIEGIGVELNLTPEEKEFFQQHPTINVHMETGYAPLSYVDNGIFVGYSIDYADLIASKLGVKFEYKRNVPWKQAIEDLKDLRIDVIAQMINSEERQKFTLFTEGYLTYYQGIVTPRDSEEYKTLDQLYGKTVGVVKGYYTEDVIREFHKPITLKTYPDNLVLLDAVVKEEVDAAISTHQIMQHNITELFLKDLVVSRPLLDDAHLSVTQEAFGVRKDWPLLHSAIQKAIDATLTERLTLQRTWFGADESALKRKKTALTEEERAWLKSKGSIKMCVDPNWLPYERVDESGQHVGIASEILEMVQKRSGIKLELVPTQNWSETLVFAKERKCDIISAAMRTPSRSEYLDFTAPFLSFPWVIATRDEELFISDFRTVQSKPIGIIKGFANAEILKSIYPNIQIIDVDSVEDGLNRVRDGKVFGFIDTVATITYAIQKAGMEDIKISGKLEETIELSIATRNDEPLLNSIMQKAIDTVSEVEILHVFNRWLSMTVKTKPDFTLLWQLLSVVAVGFVLIVFWNISLQRARKEAVAARQAADQANLAKNTFLANMSHELRTPLTAILGYSRMMGQDAEASSSQLDRLSIINNAGEHLLKMINEVLDLSKIEAGRLEIHPSGIDLQQLLEDISRMFEMRAEEAGLEFELFVKLGAARYIESDAGKLRQILINLLGNAVKFTREGRITLQARVLPIEGDRRMAALQIEVKDSGPGVSPEKLAHIFEPFVQGEKYSDAKQGSGLGLTICKSFVDAMGGTIGVKSEPGKGTLFNVEIPVKLIEELDLEGKEFAWPKVIGLESDQTAWRILVVEDNPDNRLLISDLLAPLGFEVRSAENGKEAVVLFKQWHPHFIWMDMRMPVMDGYEATRRVRDLPSGRDVRIVALTASVLQDAEHEAIDAGCDDLIHKPFQEHEIFQCLKDQLGVRYIFQESTPPNNSAQTDETKDEAVFTTMSKELRESLQKAVDSQNVELINELLTQLRKADPAMAQLLGVLAKDHRYDQILELLS